MEATDQPSGESDAEYGALLAASVDDLLAEIGRSLGDELFAPRSFRDSVRAGGDWMDENLGRLRDRVCPHATEIDDATNPTTAIAALADLLASLHNVPAVATVATLVYRYGVASLCEHWDEDDKT